MGKQENQNLPQGQESAAFFSIIIPVYNCEKYISDCLDSCLEQDLPPNEYEIICIDDGSTDQSPQILDAYEAEHENVKVIHKENGGASTARNAGINAATGKYIWFVDSDDLIQENVLSKLKNIIEKHNVDAVYLKAYFFENRLTEEEVIKKRQFKLQPIKELKTEYCTQKIFCREVVEDNHIRFLESVIFGEDQLFNFEFFKYSKENVTIDIPTYFYRRNEDSLTHSGDPRERARTRCQSLCRIIEYLYQEFQTDSECHKKRTIWYLFLLRSLLLNFLVVLPLKEGFRELKKMEQAGIFEMERKIPKFYLPKHVKIYPRTVLRKKRFRYLFQIKIAGRLSHPVQSLKHLLKKILMK